MQLSTLQKANIFSLHLGCQVSWDKMNFQKSNRLLGVCYINVLGAVESGRYEWCVVSKDIEGFSIFEKVENARLIVKPISEITDEHAVKVTKMLHGNLLGVLEYQVDEVARRDSNEVKVKVMRTYKHLNGRPDAEMVYHVNLNKLFIKGYKIVPWDVYLFLMKNGYAVPISIEDHPDNGKNVVELGLGEYFKTEI